jgi:hypothetical protein
MNMQSVTLNGIPLSLLSIILYCISNLRFVKLLHAKNPKYTICE